MEETGFLKKPGFIGTLVAPTPDMPKRLRTDGPTYFHVLNRAVRRARLFDEPKDYEAFLAALVLAQQRVPMGLLGFCVMPNHFHLVVGPTQVPDLSRFMHRLTVIHSKRWHQYRGSTGTGPVYQGRFKAYPVQDETQFLFVCRYVERNPIRADLVERAEQWPWSSASSDRKSCNVELAGWPIPKPSSWLETLNAGRKPGVLRHPVS